MKIPTSLLTQRLTAISVLAAGLSWGAAMAATDISNTPLSAGAGGSVLPNLMFVLDDSGSMSRDYLADFVNDNDTCKQDRNGDNSCAQGQPPYYAAQFNTIYYDPQITYTPAVNYDGTSMGNEGSPWTSVDNDPFDTSTSSTNMTNGIREVQYCSDSGLTNCKRNGIDTNATFLYSDTPNAGVTNGYPDATYDRPKNVNTNAHYYTITPNEYCSDAKLTNCTAATAPTGVFIFPATVRYCKTTAFANAAPGVSGNSLGSPKCQAKYDNVSATKYIYPHYGNFTRTDIVPATTTYSNRPARLDCAAVPVCTYAEEMTNYANWWTYYRERMQMMKTAAGRAFLPIDDNYRVGIITINPGNPVNSSQYLAINKFDATQKQAWYAKFYSQGTGGLTPLREALSRVGRHYAGKTNGINNGMPTDPVEYSCQQNFTILTTDGYWNGNNGDEVDGTNINNEDNADSGLSTRAAGAFDGALSGATQTLADTALYYYKTDLRGSTGTKTTGALGTDVTLNNVPTSPKDSVSHQHMTTFTLGIVDGLMTYRSDYESATAGDFFNIKQGASGACSWTTGTCNWPVPASDMMTTLDDLWHAAVNGRGVFFQASNPTSVASGLSSALAGLNVRTAAAAASATSSPNITPTDRSIFSSTYTTGEWSGEVVAQNIDATTGVVVPTIVWSAQTQLDGKVSAASDTRSIFMLDQPTSSLLAFTWANLTATEKAYFAGACSTLPLLSQCTTTLLGLPGPLANADDGQNMVNFLRGQTQHEALEYRDRLHVLGDTINATPAYLRDPRFAFADAVTPDYPSFKLAQASRQGTLFIAANDGMLHALNGNTGDEMWAYIPKILLPNLYKLADENYATKHLYLADGSPQLMDAFVGGAWRTVLIAGLNSGGRGYYAIDVTNPLTPVAMWEFNVRASASCPSATVLGTDKDDCDLGLTYGEPVITKRASDGKWVVLVTSGYNNTSPGDGKGYLYVLDLQTGIILDKVDTGVGNTTTPAGLGHMAVWADNFNTDNTGKSAYIGDLLGNVWRFNLTTTPATVAKLADLKDASGKPQSVTTKPELALIGTNRAIFVGTGRYLGVTDLQDPATLIPPSNDAYQQSIYAIKDKGTSAWGDIRAGGKLVQQNIVVVTATSRTTSSNAVNWLADAGWYADFNPASDSPGERVTINPQLLLGTLLVTTNVPNTNACTVGGDSWQYQFNYLNGQYVSTSPGGEVGKKLSNAITVGVVVVRLANGQLKAIATDAAGNKTTFGVNIGSGAASAKRTGWRELIK